MDLIWEKFTEWLKELLVGGIMDNLTGLFDNVNAKVAEAAGHIGSTPQAWNAGIYSIQNWRPCSLSRGARGPAGAM